MIKRYRAWREQRRRQTFQRLFKRYAAAQISRMTGDWLPVVQDVNDLIKSASPIVRQRVQQLVRDFPPFAAAAARTDDFVVGSGIRFQSRAVDAKGNPDKRVQGLIEDHFKGWMDQASLDGTRHFYELQRLARRQRTECGERLAVFREPHGRGRHPVALDFIDPHRLDDTMAPRVDAGNELLHGIEFNRYTGERVRFHISSEPVNGLPTGRVVAVPAEDVLFSFRQYRPGQLRGISDYAPAVLLANDMASYMDANIDRAKLASKWVAVATSPDPASMQQGRTEVDEDGIRVETVENGEIWYMRTGDTVTVNNANLPGDQFAPFVKFLLQMVAVVTGIPYEILSGDYAGINYTTLRGSRTDFRQVLKPMQWDEIQHFCQPVFHRWLDWEVLTGRIDLPGYERNKYAYRRCLWIPAGMPPIDPLKEIKAAIEAIKVGLMAPQQFILEQGQDPDEVLDLIQNWNQQCADRDLGFSQALAGASTAVANNPAALDGKQGVGTE